MIIKNGIPDACRGFRLYCLDDGAAAKDDIVVVENNSLAGGDGSLRLVKYNPENAVFHGVNSGGLLGHAAAGLCHAPKRSGGSRGEPVPVCSLQYCGKQRFVGANGDGIGCHILAANIHRCAHGES